jgi:ATP adenylyltransferase
MEYIWSPWRIKYVQEHERVGGCIFCNALQEEDGPQNLVLVRGQYNFVILNRYPYTNAHLMVAPIAHVAELEDLDAVTRGEMMELISTSIQVIRKVYEPEAFNVGANIGKFAGAGVVDHVHMHVVPRWAGDANFLSTIGMTRVLPEELADTLLRLRQAW